MHEVHLGPLLETAAWARWNLWLTCWGCSYIEMGLRLQQRRGHLLTSLVMPAFFLSPAKWLPPVGTGKGSALFLSCTASGMCRISQDLTVISSYLREWDIAGSVSSFLLLTGLNLGKGRRQSLGCYLGLKELISLETFKSYAQSRSAPQLLKVGAECITDSLPQGVRASR